ncbi:hypothetical protein ABVK25_002441 [Lepraria finkii]|uniref:Tetraspanin n=1 Tax=Lepraria finkii TaxID=1340010 RepID=A0ABR4BHU4_9LECA
MRPWIKVLSLLVPLVLLGLIVTAGIATDRIKNLGIPISIVTATATTLLPVITAGSLLSTQKLASGFNGSLANAKLSISWTTIVVFMLLIIYDTIIATLALNHMTPPSNLTCHLEQQWGRLFSSKNAEIIRRIQDRHQCCGLHSVVDKAWPFADGSHPVTACRDAFNRQNSCFGEWRRDEQITAGLLLLVAGVMFLIKLIMIFVYRTRNPFLSHSWQAHGSSNGTDDDGLEANEEEVRERNIRGRIEGSYHD